MMASILGSPFSSGGGSRRPAAPEPSPEEVNSLLRMVGSAAGGTVGALGHALSTPGDYARGLLVEPGTRATSGDLLRAAGLIGDDSWSNLIPRIAVDIATDPLTYITGPLGSLSKAGTVLKRAGLLDEAATAVSKRLLNSGQPLTGQAKSTADSLAKQLGRAVSATDPILEGRPLVGSAVARRTGTIDDVLRYSKDPQVRQKLLDAAGGQAQLNAIARQPLAKSFGVGLPFSEPALAGDFLGGTVGGALAAATDAVGNKLRWSLPGRVTAALVDHRVDNAIDPVSQALNIASAAAKQRGRARALAENTAKTVRVAMAHPDSFSSADNTRAITRFLEGPQAATAADNAFVAARPEIYNYARDWHTNVAPAARTQSQALGIPVTRFQDPYGIFYVPREAHRALEVGQEADGLLTRGASYKVPGGTDTLHRLSLDPRLTGSPAQRLATDADAAQYVLKELQAIPRTAAQPAPTIEQATEIARLLRWLPSDAAQQIGLFGQTPFERIGNYLQRNYMRQETADMLHDALANAAVHTPGGAAAVPGGGHVPITDALEALGLSYNKAATPAGSAVGAIATLKQRLAQVARHQFSGPDAIDINNVSIPRDMLRRLQQARSAAGATTLFSNHPIIASLDAVTSNWKSFIASWPAFAVRNLYSGQIANWLQNAFDPQGVSAVKGLVSKGPTDRRFQAYLADIPRYAAPGGIERFYADVASTGLLPEGVYGDLADSATGASAIADLPGFRPRSLSGATHELASGRSVGDYLSYRTRANRFQRNPNPLLRAGEHVNELVENVNRLSGFLSLVRQGYAPEAASAAIKAVQGGATLSTFERSVARRIMPWYSYNSRIFPAVLKTLVERPGGKYGAMLRASEATQQQSNDGTYIPSYLRSQLAIPVPAELGGTPAEGLQTYVADFDAPGLKPLNMLSIRPTANGVIGDTARQLAMQLAPYLRVPAELAFNRDLFTNKPLDETTSPLDVIASRVTGQRVRTPAAVSKLLEIVPGVQRPVYLARTLLDNRTNAPLTTRLVNAAVNTLTGVKRRTLSRADVLGDAVREIDSRNAPYTRQSNRRFVPKDLEATTPPNVLLELAIRDLLAQQVREYRAAHPML